MFFVNYIIQLQPLALNLEYSFVESQWGQRDRFRWPATNDNILGISHIPNHQCRSQIPRHQEEAHIPCCHNGRYRLSPFELWSMERL